MSLGVYVHLPFCRVRCTYCPFAVSTDHALEEAYFDALLMEIDARVAGAECEAPVASLYLGGGTPSRSSLANLTRLLARLRKRFTLDAAAEVTLEANPEDITAEAIAAWRALGVNRLSIGVQSFRDDELLPLGRVHGGARARQAVALAVASGLRTSLDLILGLPAQTAESFLATLDEAIASGTGHVSLYMLDLEEGTALHGQVARGRTLLPEDDLVATLYLQAVERLTAAGLAQYEISNFARPGDESRHNLRYWQREHYYGFGLGAHSFLGEERFANTRAMDRYLAAPAAASDFHERLGAGEARREAIFLNLRQAGGIHYDALVTLCGQEGLEWIDRGLREGWLRRVESRVAFTPAGFLLSNSYISQLF
jgi:oxygen-independent coproporphyrinogen-3 oxidase